MPIDIGVTVTEFARRMGVSRQRVHMWIAKTPGLRPAKIGSVTLLSAADQARILSRPKGKPGRPRKIVVDKP